MTVFDKQFEMLNGMSSLKVIGTVVGVSGLVVTAEDFPVPIGSRCAIIRRLSEPLEAEVVGFQNSKAIVMPYGELTGVAPGDKIECRAESQQIAVGEQLLGRVIDGFGKPMDFDRPLLTAEYYPLENSAPDAIKRKRVTEPIGTGIRAIDSLLTVGKGQRMGIFAGPGVGKSILMGMIARYSSADVIVIGLVGERGREVRDFIERDLGEEGRKRSVVVVSTSDQSPVLRIRATLGAISIAEYFRDKGKDVLLLVDSLTRLAMAQRQIGLAVGEPPATKGYTPSVFSLLPKLLERAGQSHRGSITGFYTVLVEGDDITEPISDAVRGILDGHLWLSRNLANKGHYPAISILESISRTMPDIVDEEHFSAALKVKRLITIYTEMEDMINIGAYVPGSNPEVDVAIKIYPAIEQFLRQGMKEYSNADDAQRKLIELAAMIDKEQSNSNSNRQTGNKVSQVA